MGFNKNNKGNNSFNYFTREIQKDGNDFLEKKNAVQIQRDAPFVFRQLAKGQIDIFKYVDYFNNQYFLSNLIDAAQVEYNEHSICRMGIQALVNQRRGYDNTFTQQECDLYYSIMNRHYALENAYNIILYHFKLFATTKDPYTISTMVGQLQNAKYQYIL